MNSALPRRTANKTKRMLRRAAHVGAPLFTYLVLTGCSSGQGGGQSESEEEHLGSISSALTTRYEAENGTYSACTLTSNTSASGGKYLDASEGATITWTVSSTGGSNTLAFATKNPSGTGRKMGVFVNSTKVGVITTDNSTLPFTTKSVTATLVNGNNTIKLQDTEATGEPDVDYLEVSTTSCTPSCSGKMCGSNGCGGVCGVCAMGKNCDAAQQCVTGTAAYYNTGKTLEATPNFGPNVKVYTPATAAATIQSGVNAIYSAQHTNQFGTRRDAILFTPGTYSTTLPVGFNTQIAGLGDHPDAVNLTGYISCPPDFLPNNNGTQTFWRIVENFKNSHTAANMLWAVSQAAPMRRVHHTGTVQLHLNYGWQSGGFIADSVIDGYLLLGSQQQWYTRNSHVANAVEGTWNIMFQGTTGTKSQAAFPTGPLTNMASAPVIREKPFLYVNRDGKYHVFAPAIRTNASGPTWTGTQAGTQIPLSSFYIAKPGDTASTMNTALSQGKHLLITPGIYNLSAPLAINNANTVVLGMGLATLVPQGGVKAITVADVDGVKLAGLLIDAGTTNSPVLVEVGPTSSAASHSSNPTSLHDIFVRIGGGSFVGKATVSLQVNSKNVIIDHIWLWRADHSDTAGVVGWSINTAQNGLVVNGSDVTSYGTFVEHFQQYQTLWNGNNGKNYFYQNELPYDAPSQASWMNGTSKGWAAYKVANTVVNHESWGMGSYAVFTMNSCTTSSQCTTGVCGADGFCTAPNPIMQADRSYEVPDAQLGVKLRNMVALSLTGKGKIQNLLNSNGMTANALDFSTYPKLAAFH